MTEDSSLLGVELGANRALVRRAWAEKRRLYDSSAVATYGLLTDEERAALLQRLDDAYRRLTGEEPPSEAPPAHDVQLPPAPEADPAPLGEEPPREDVGAHLGFHRRRRGWSIDQVARKTKIRPPLLAALEEERADDLPADAYVRGYVVQVAEALGLEDPSDLARRYLERVRGGAEE